MASVKDTASFFANGTTKQFDYCFKLYPEVLKLKAEARCKKPDELVRLDEWYQNELPQRIKQRGKDAHMVHEELVQTMKWKQSRGKYFPQLSYLVKVNTPRAVMQETKKAFRKLPNLEQAITALSNLKGVGTTMASALLAAAAPDSAPFMADECLMAIPEIEGIDYTTKEYLNFVQHIQTTVNRLNSEKDSTSSWSPHRVELALWTHYVATDLKPELLDGIPQGGIMNLSTKKFSTTGDDIDDTDDDDKNGIADGDDIKMSNQTSSSSSSSSTNPTILKQTNGGSSSSGGGGGAVITINHTDDNSISNDSQENDIIIDNDIMNDNSKIIQLTNSHGIGDKEPKSARSTVDDNATNSARSNINIDDEDDDDDDDEDEEEDDDDDDDDIVISTISTPAPRIINFNKTTEEQEKKLNKLQKNTSSTFVSPTLLIEDATNTSSTTTNDDDIGTPTNTIEQSDESNMEILQLPANGNNGNGALDSLDESTRSEDSLEKPTSSSPIVINDETNDSDSYNSSVKRSIDCESSESSSQPELKKLRSE